MPNFLRRGKETDAVFARARRARVTHHSFGMADITEDVPVATARLAFEDRRRVRMERRLDGSFYFIDPTQWGFTRYEIWP